MFILQRVALTNFRSFRGEHTFKFPTKPGLYCVTGENKDNPRLGREGIGKSSLLEAVFWALYGKTARSLKGNDIVSWGAKSCSVAVTLIINDVHYYINRGQSPNMLLLDSIPVDQEAINKLLRLGPEAFAYAIILPQFGDSFFDLTPANKLTLFSDIMELDFWLEKSQEAASTAKELTELKISQDHALAKSHGRLEAVKADIEKLTLEVADFDRKKAIEVSALGAKLKLTKISILKEEKQLASAKEGLTGAERRLAKLGAPTVTAGYSANALRGTLAKMSGLGAQCPTCLQTVSASHLKAETARLKAELVKTEAEVKKAVELAQDHRVITQNRDDFAREVRHIENTIFSLKKDSEVLAAKIAAEGKAANPYGGLLTRNRQEVEKLTVGIKQMQGEIDEISADLAAVNYWVSGFKRVRLFLVEETIKQLEIEVNNNLANLGLTDWRIEFDIERENKSGGVTKGFTVLVYAPGHKQPVKYESWCGGETQRLRLAGDLGLADLIMERAGLSSGFEAFDEPSQHMGDEGLADLAETLAERAENSGKICFLVDHHNIDFGGFAGTINIIKDEKGSHIT